MYEDEGFYENFLENKIEVLSFKGTLE